MWTLYWAISKELDKYLNIVRIYADKYEKPEYFHKLTLSPRQVEYKPAHIPMDGRVWYVAATAISIVLRRLYKVITDLECLWRQETLSSKLCLWRTRAYGYSETAYRVSPPIQMLPPFNWRTASADAVIRDEY